MNFSQKDRDVIIEQANKASDELQVSQLIEEVTNILSVSPADIELIHLRAQLFEKQQEWANAINDYLKILSYDKNDKRAKTQSEMLKTILRYNNIDIYSSPNTNYDPWFE